jgi:O-antigen/teichoic acid export membrane protein
MSVGGGFLRSGGIYTLANILSAGVPFLMLPVLTRVLSSGEFGQVTIFFAVFSFSAALAGLGLHGAVGVRWFDSDRKGFPGYVSSCISVSVASTAIVSVLTLAAVTIAGSKISLPPVWAALAVVAAGCNSLLLFRLTLWQNQGQPVRAALFQFSNSVVNVILSVVGVVALGLGAAGRMGGAGAAYVLMAVASIFLLFQTGMAAGMPTRGHIASALRYGLPLVPHGLAGVVMATADRFIVAEQLGAAAVGIYGVAAQLGAIMNIASDAFVRTYSPWMYERLSRANEGDQLALVGMSYLSIPVFLLAAACLGGSIAFAGPAIVGDEFRAALPLVWWFVLGGAFTGMYYSVAGFFLFSSRTELISLVTGVSSIVGLPLCYWLVGLKGLEGGAIAFAVTQAMLFVLALVVSILTKPLPWNRVSSGVSAALLHMRGG